MLTETDVLALVHKTPDDPRCAYAVDPEAMYLAMADHIQAGLASGAWSRDDHRAGYIAQATALPAEAWDLMLQPYDEVQHAENRVLRATAMRIARKWFQELLHEAIGGDGVFLSLRILRNPAYRTRP